MIKLCIAGPVLINLKNILYEISQTEHLQTEIIVMGSYKEDYENNEEI